MSESMRELSREELAEVSGGLGAKQWWPGNIKVYAPDPPIFGPITLSYDPPR